ncbi:MAG: EamA family transporter [Pseudolabrys sp.]|nr:EamA family transporter [Pseudolabrys sp.]
MTPGLGFAVAAMLCFGASDLIYKRAATGGVDGRQFAMLQAWVFCPGVTLYAWLTGTLHLNAAALWGALAGGFLLVAVINFVTSLRDTAVSTNAPVFRLNFTVTAALAILILGEPLNATKAIAIGCTLAAVWLLLVEPGARLPPIRSMTRILAATVAMGLGNFCYKLGVGGGALPETMIAAQAWVFCPSATLIYWLTNRRFIFTPGAWRYGAAAAIVLIAGFVLLLHGLSSGYASVLVPVAQMGFVITAVLGAVLFRERLGVRKIIGIAIAVAALSQFALS